MHDLCRLSTTGFTAQKDKPIKFKVLGDERITCRMMLVKTGIKKLPDFTVMLNGQKDPLKGKPVADGNKEYLIPGDSTIKISL